MARTSPPHCQGMPRLKPGRDLHGAAVVDITGVVGTRRLAPPL